MKFSEEQPVTPFLDHKRNEDILVELKVEPADDKLRRWQTKLATTCTRKEQQDAKNNAELETKWVKKTWKTFEETIRQGQNRSIKMLLMTDEDYYYYYYYYYYYWLVIQGDS
jgi:hypothetical protein